VNVGTLARWRGVYTPLPAPAVNSGIVLLYWQIGQQIRKHVLRQKRAEYGQEIFVALSKELGWSHFVELLPLNKPMQRDFYAEMCRIGHWSVRTLRHKIGSMLYERTACHCSTKTNYTHRQGANMRESSWDIYFVQIDNLPAGFVLDLAAFDEQSAAQRPQLIIVSVKFRQTDARGFPDRAEDSALNNIEDALAQIYQPTGAKYVARVTAHGRRDFIFYAPANANAQGAAQRALKTFAGYDYKVKADSDPAWSFYRETLYPSERDMQCIQDRRVLANLQRNGDTLEIPRFLNHWAYFSDAAKRQAFIDQTEARGFRTKSLHESEKGDLHFCAVLDRKDSVQLRAINGVTLELFDLARSYAGRYDGWECKVIATPEDASEY
jgi:uncharacterized protein (TIGR01619 family)